MDRAGQKLVFLGFSHFVFGGCGVVGQRLSSPTALIVHTCWGGGQDSQNIYEVRATSNTSANVSMSPHAEESRAKWQADRLSILQNQADTQHRLWAAAIARG